ncbi:formyl transferase [Lacicoccus alkaliphilus]|uniref:phosphoribosylglycinamide formyltransferase 1 n=1 Tax=Lacicoccus alkaliphilus DSM 16010 TaxID=1123231 RepID=A0A1M7CUL9_9BACL|nr:formyl transferase [Salinicoccus alkaliphilus]SHL70942.1 Formyl transferase [Salinicoccus alkaliphilus DSM 16010]
MNKIIMICGEGDQSNYVYNHVVKDFDVSRVFIVGEGSRRDFLKRRIKKLGLFKFIGQVLFVMYTKLFLRKEADRRIEAIRQEYGLDETDIPDEKKEYIGSVNSDHMRKRLGELQPDLVIINGTPIIKRHILEAVDGHFLNIHVGITPKYRGVHGGYWALYNNEGTLAGVTTHFVDTGIDTGAVLDQKMVQVTGGDNFLTYTHLQAAAALENYNDIVKSILDDDFHLMEPLTEESRIWSHPTLLQYIYGRLVRKVK